MPGPLLIKFYYHKFFKLSLAIIITVLTLVSCDHITSFNDGKNVRDIGLTCWYHLTNIIPYRISHESMRQGIIALSCLFVCLFVCFFVCIVCLFLLFFVFFFFGFSFCRVILLVFLGWKRWNQFYHYNISGPEKVSNYNGLTQMGLISLQ